MSEQEAVNDNSEMTLDPPGRIAVIGADVLGLEAALYGRFLGYDVVVWEREQELGHGWDQRREQPLEVLPSASLSSLARAALQAQSGSSGLPDPSLPLTVGQWIDQGWYRLAATDLLRGRVRSGCEVQAIELVEVELIDDAPTDNVADDPDTEIDGDVPPDFRLSLAAPVAPTGPVGFTGPVGYAGPVGNAGPVGGTGPAAESLDFEAIILACSDAAIGRIQAEAACWQSPYCFTIGAASAAPLSESLPTGLQKIVRLYAQLGGRPTLDLYRPQRL